MPQSAESLILRPVTSFLFKGHNGTGKTILSCGKEFRPVYVFNCEGRFESVPIYYKKLDGHAKDIEFDNFPLGSGYYGIDKRMDDLIKNCPYKTVVMSSLTSFIYLILKHLIDSKTGTNAQGREYGMKIGGIPVNELRDFNAEDSAIINDLISFFQQLKAQGVNTIMEAHITPYEIVSLNEGQRESVTINQILTKGKKAPASVPGFFNEIYLFHKEYQGIVVGNQSVGYKVNTKGTATDDCKTSWGINSFDWTGKDGSENIFGQLGGEIKNNSPQDPNAPKRVSMGAK